MKVQSRNNEQLVRVCAHTLEFIHKCTNFSKQISCLVLSLRDYARGITVARPTACKAVASRCYSVMFYLRLREGLEIPKSHLSDRLLYKRASVDRI